MEHIQINMRKSVGRVPTRGGWMDLFHLCKAVVVCDDVAVFKSFPHRLVTLKEQFVCLNMSSCSLTISKTTYTHPPHHLLHTALKNG